MSSPFDETDFIDRDFQVAQKSPYAPASAAPAAPTPMTESIGNPHRPPSREELDQKVNETHLRLAELKRAQEALERERSALEEARRRRAELQTGREEMLEHMTRGIGLLEEAEFNSRREAEAMAKALGGFREALSKVQAIRDESWTEENWNVELTRALTTLENARMEWNAARLRFPLLSGDTAPSSPAGSGGAVLDPKRLAAWRMTDLCKLGFAITWPIAAVLLLASGLFLLLLLNR
jgi:hypothetical protein